MAITTGGSDFVRLGQHFFFLSFRTKIKGFHNILNKTPFSLLVLLKCSLISITSLEVPVPVFLSYVALVNANIMTQVSAVVCHN
jgi:hypothetical protein